MAIDLVTKFQPYVDEQFKNESKRDLLTNQDFTWEGAHHQGLQNQHQPHERL